MLSNHPNCLGGNGPSASSDLIGDVDGPASATDNAVARFDGTTGKLIQNSTVTIADTTGAIAGAQSLTSPASTPLTLATGTSGAAITVLSASNNVGIGTTSPAARLDIASAASTVSLKLAGAANEWTEQLTANSTSGQSYGMLLDAGTNSSDVTLRIRSQAGTDYMYVRGDGNVLIGTTDATGLTGSGGLKINSTTAGASNAGALVVAGGIGVAGASYFGGAVTVAGTFKVTDGTYGVYAPVSDATLNFNFDQNADGTGYINYRGYNGSNTRFRSLIISDGKTATIATFDGPTKAATFVGAVSVGTGAAVGGATAGAGGLAFPATAVAVADVNTLDDYEEGTWTPASGSAAMTGTSGASGKYTKTGRTVYCTGQISYTDLTGGDVTISGLPLPNGSVRQATVNVFLGAAGTSVKPVVVESSDSMFYFTPDASHSGGARTASFSCWYQV